MQMCPYLIGHINSGGRVRQTNYSRLPLKRRLTFEVALNKAAAADLMTWLNSGLILPCNKGSEKCGGDDCAGVPWNLPVSHSCTLVSHWCTLVSHWCSTPVVPHWCHNAGVHGVTLDFRAPASLTATAAPKRLHPAKKPGWHCCWWSVAHRAFIQLKKVHYKHQQISKSNGFPFLFWLGEKSFLRSSLSSGIRRDVCLFKTSSPSSTLLLLPPGTLRSKSCQSVFSQTWSVDPTCSSDTA